jgi:phosphopantothenoylcysteine decarboxylase/phosphopantothenate--cysteine ligase
VFWPNGQASIGPDSKTNIARELVAMISEHLGQTAR